MMTNIHSNYTYQMGPLNQDSRNGTGAPSRTTLFLVKSFVRNSWHRPTGPSRKLLGQVCPRIPQCRLQEGDVAQTLYITLAPKQVWGHTLLFLQQKAGALIPSMTNSKHPQTSSSHSAITGVYQKPLGFQN